MRIKRIVLDCSAKTPRGLTTILDSIEKLKRLPPKKQGFEARIIRVDFAYPHCLYTVWDLPKSDGEYDQERIRHMYHQDRLNKLYKPKKS